MSMLEDLKDLFSLEQINRNLNETEAYIDQKIAEMDSVIKTAGHNPAMPKKHLDAEWVARTALKKIKMKFRKL